MNLDVFAGRRSASRRVERRLHGERLAVSDAPLDGRPHGRPGLRIHLPKDRLEPRVLFAQPKHEPHLFGPKGLAGLGIQFPPAHLGRPLDAAQKLLGPSQLALFLLGGLAPAALLDHLPDGLGHELHVGGIRLGERLLARSAVDEADGPVQLLPHHDLRAVVAGQVPCLVGRVVAPPLRLGVADGEGPALGNDRSAVGFGEVGAAADVNQRMRPAGFYDCVGAVGRVDLGKMPVLDPKSLGPSLQERPDFLGGAQVLAGEDLAEGTPGGVS